MNVFHRGKMLRPAAPVPLLCFACLTLQFLTRFLDRFSRSFCASLPACLTATARACLATRFCVRLGPQPFCVSSSPLSCFPSSWLAMPSAARAPSGPPAPPTGEKVDEFFQLLEQQVPFPAAELEQLIPAALLQHWKDLGATQSVAWPWVMLCELCLVSFLTPNARFLPLPSFAVYSLTWTFFLHPGSCHTSNLLRLYHNVLHGLEDKANEDRRAMRARLRQHAMPGAQGQAALKERLKKLQHITFRLGTGSLEGIGLRIASFVGWTAASGYLVEGTQFLQWLQAEFGVNKAIATQLWERMSWQRDVINLQRSFSMAYPFLGVCGALHLEDIWPLYAHADPLGLRGRLCLFYSRPVMKRAREIEAANERLGNIGGTNQLETLLIDRFYRVYQAHALEHRDEAVFVHHLGYPFLNYTFAADNNEEAKQIFVAHFDHHANLQEENYLVQHEASKRHGKLKGKHLRLALNWTNLQSAFAATEPTAWPTTVSASAMQAADLLGKYCEGVTDVIYKFIARSSQSPEPAPAAQQPREERGMVGRIARLRDLSLAAFLEQHPVASHPHLHPFTALLLRMHSIWLDSTLLKSHCFIRDHLPQASHEEKMQLILLAFFCLEKLQLAACGLSTNNSGPRKLFACKRHLPPGAPHLAAVQAVLSIFEVPLEEYRAPSPGELQRDVPNAAPRLDFPPFDGAVAAAAPALLNPWRGVA